MITITVREHQGSIENLRIHGHANAAEHGKDLVCAGVSAIGVGMLNGLDQLSHETCTLSMDDGDIQVIVNQTTTENQMILKTVMVQLETMAQTNKSFIRIKKQEV